MVVAVNSLCRVPGVGPELQNGGGCWVDNKPFSLTTQCQYSYLLFLLIFTLPTENYHFFFCLLSVILIKFVNYQFQVGLSIHQVFHSVWLAFWNIFKQYLKNLLHNIFRWFQEDCYWETCMYMLNTDKMYEFMTLTLWPHLTYVKGLKSWINTSSLCVTIGFLGNISFKSLWAFAMKQ